MIRMTNLMNAMTSVNVPQSRVCDGACWEQGKGDFTDFLQMISKSEF